jgi:plastocyanin
LNLRPRAPLWTCACAAAALAGCGSSGSSSSSSTAPASKPATPATSTPKAGSAAHLALTADPSGQLLYVQKSLHAKAGTVTIDFTNKSSVPHDVAVAHGSSPLGTSSVIMGSKTAVTLTLTKGTYTYYCTVDGHRMAGMQGTLTVS